MRIPPTHLMSVDPGVRGCGAAYFHRGHLNRATYVPSLVNGSSVNPNSWRCMATAVRQWFGDLPLAEGSDACLVIERMKVYAGGKAKGDPADLINVTAVSGVIIGMVRYSVEVYGYFGRDWKGTVTKEVSGRRILAALAPWELDRIQRVGAKDHNTLDAVGIGLHHLGRLKDDMRWVNADPLQKLR